MAESYGLKKNHLRPGSYDNAKKITFKIPKKKTVKSKKLMESDYIKYTFFLKIFCRCIRLGLKFIFIGESGFYLHNNHFINWVEDGEEIYFYKRGNKKINLLLVVSNEEINHYKLQKDNTTSSNFKKFIEEIIEKINPNGILNYVMILDNCTCHLTEELFRTYFDNNLKILFNVPYLSSFIMVENVFMLIKNHTYKKLYDKTEELKYDIKAILNDNRTKLSLNKLFLETLEVYIQYIEKNGKINF